MTYTKLVELLRTTGVWRADIREATDEPRLWVHVPANCKNAARLERKVRAAAPALLRVDVVRSESVNFHCRKKGTYNVTRVLPGRVRQIRIEGAVEL